MGSGDEGKIKSKRDFFFMMNKQESLFSGSFFLLSQSEEACMEYIDASIFNSSMHWLLLNAVID
mgnify:CR=1 FL=1